jgi:putative FmdB family regulatory protein
MPTYAYRCGSCNLDFDKILPMSRFRDPQKCPDCGAGPAKKRITAGSGFILRGDGWAGKNNRVRGQMRKKNQRLDAKQKDRTQSGSGGVRLTPNVDGQRVESWSDATKLASSKGKDTSGYEGLARKENNG